MGQSVLLKPISSLEKCFIDESADAKKEQTFFKIFKGQPLVYQIAVSAGADFAGTEWLSVSTGGDLAPYTTVRTVVSVPVHSPVSTAAPDDDYLRTAPGLFPDLLSPLHYREQIALQQASTQTLWIRADVPAHLPAGDYSLTVNVGETPCTITVRLLDCALPPQKLIHTEWFYTDCLADYYHVKPFSEKHWRIVRNFVQAAVRNGVNMILTPIFTPELDTYIGGERTTTQLLQIEKTSDHRYSFDFTLVERWVEMCRACGICYFEIPHFFTQWGAKHAPKIVVRVAGKPKKLFGWHTDALGAEYKEFLSQLIPALVAWLKEKGIADKTYFHISDEPSAENLEQYRACKELVTQYLEGLPTMDALSDYAFYETGAVDHPIPHIRNIQTFLDHHVPDLWAYFYGHMKTGMPGRCISLPLSRTRILGTQLYYAGIFGFLHWGFNFYNNKNSYDRINPFLYTDGESFGASGNMFLVYPGENGEAWESLRLNALREGLEDMRMLSLCEQKLGREKTKHILCEEFGREPTFFTPPDEDYFDRLRNRIVRELGL